MILLIFLLKDDFYRKLKGRVRPAGRGLADAALEL